MVMPMLWNMKRRRKTTIMDAHMLIMDMTMATPMGVMVMPMVVMVTLMAHPRENQVPRRER